MQNQKIIATDGYLIFPSDEGSYSVIFSDFAISACTDDPYRIAVGKTHKSGASNIPQTSMCFLGTNDVSQLHLLGVRLDFTALPAQNASQRFCTDDPYIINQAEFMGNCPNDFGLFYKSNKKA